MTSKQKGFSYKNYMMSEGINSLVKMSWVAFFVSVSGSVIGWCAVILFIPNWRMATALPMVFFLSIVWSFIVWFMAMFFMLGNAIKFVYHEENMEANLEHMKYQERAKIEREQIKINLYELEAGGYVLANGDGLKAAIQSSSKDE